MIDWICERGSEIILVLILLLIIGIQVISHNIKSMHDDIQKEAIKRGYATYDENNEFKWKDKP